MAEGAYSGVMGMGIRLAIVLAFTPLAAAAQDAPIVVVVESNDPAITPDAFRRQLSEALGITVQPLGGTASERSVVMVQVLTGEPARVRIQRPGQAPRRSVVARGPGSWLLAGVIEAMRGASLVTWEGDTRRVAGPQLADWEEPAEPVESGAALDPPPR